MKRVSLYQYKIAIAAKIANVTKLKEIQRLLVSSFRARALAVKQVVSNSGRKSAGVDNVI
jgi:RNA-directed DNA polymerase